MNVRKVNAKEAWVVHDVLLENGRWMLAKGIEQWPVEWLESIEDEISESVVEGNFWCGDFSGEIGAVVEVKQAAEALWGVDDQPSADVHKLAIRRAHSDKGLGGKLLNFVLDKARSERLEYVRLDCVASNRRLRDYYEGHGFRFVRVENNGEVDLALYQLLLQTGE